MKLIVITGPTGVGKTELCLQLAEHYGTEIINADSRQIYKEIPIGTAAPTAEQQQRVRHHFVGNHHIGDYYSASLYEQDVLALLESYGKDNSDNAEGDKCNSKDVMILTGGSMMYIDAVCNGIDDIPTVDDETRQTMKRRLEEEGLPTLLEELRQLDPKHYEEVDRNNPRRVIHALEICHITGKPYSLLRTGRKKERSFDIIKIGLTRDTILKVKRGQVIMDHSALYERINARVLQMIDEGLEEEARRMLPYRGEVALNTIGYKELFKYFDGEIDREEAIRQIQSDSREYARKQLTWFKRDKGMTWFHPDNITEIMAFIDESLNRRI